MGLTDIEYTARIGEVIKQHRVRLGLYQEQAADRAGMRQSRWSRIETGHVGATVPTLRRCAEALGLTLPELLQEVENGD